MRYVKIERTEGRWGGEVLDADEYVAMLPEIRSQLPEGARKFATDEQHYDFFGVRCVKDLQFHRMNIWNRSDRLDVDLLFLPNEFKHDQGLVIQYQGIVEFAAVTSSVHMGSVQLDEILPNERGFSHEIKLVGGKLWVTGKDLFAEWVAVDMLKI